MNMQAFCSLELYEDTTIKSTHLAVSYLCADDSLYSECTHKLYDVVQFT